MTPKIGVPRVYGPAALPLLYPGEHARADVDQAALQALIRTAVETADTGQVAVPVVGWIVEPVPGWAAWRLRTRYRLWGQWVQRMQAWAATRARRPA